MSIDKRAGHCEAGAAALIGILSAVFLAVAQPALARPAEAGSVPAGMHSKALWGESPIPEPYPYVSAGGLTGEKVPESADPLVAYRWPNPKAADGLEIYLVQPRKVSTDQPAAFKGLQSLTGKSAGVTVQGPGSIRLDFGLEHAAWVEFDSPDCPGEVEMSISEYNDLAPGKTRAPVKHGNTLIRNCFPGAALYLTLRG